jgi:hypothetical protein
MMYQYTNAPSMGDMGKQYMSITNMQKNNQDIVNYMSNQQTTQRMKKNP